MMIETRIESGIEMQTMIVLRQLPMNSRIISPVRQAAISASRRTPWIDARTNNDWSASIAQLQIRRRLRHHAFLDGVS